jgi:hypothetical protein
MTTLCPGWVLAIQAADATGEPGNMNAGTAGGGSVGGPATAAGAGGAGVTRANVGGGGIAAASSTTTTASATSPASTSAAAPPDRASAVLVRIFIRRPFLVRGPVRAVGGSTPNRLVALLNPGEATATAVGGLRSQVWISFIGWYHTLVGYYPTLVEYPCQCMAMCLYLTGPRDPLMR